MSAGTRTVVGAGRKLIETVPLAAGTGTVSLVLRLSEKPSKPKLVSRKGLSPRLHLSAGPVAQSPVEMPTTSLNCKVRSDNIKSIQNPTSMKSSFPVPPILTSTPPSHHRARFPARTRWSCRERLPLALRHRSRSAGQRCPRPGRVAHGFRQAAPTRRGLR